MPATTSAPPYSIAAAGLRSRDCPRTAAIPGGRRLALRLRHGGYRISPSAQFPRRPESAHCRLQARPRRRFCSRRVPGAGPASPASGRTGRGSVGSPVGA